MSVAEEADMPLKGSNDMSLAVSMSELEWSDVICDQDIGGRGCGGTGHKLDMGAYEGRARYTYPVGEGAGGGPGHGLDHLRRCPSLPR
jgi:hypothetical protein